MGADLISEGSWFHSRGAKALSPLFSVMTVTHAEEDEDSISTSLLFFTVSLLGTLWSGSVMTQFLTNLNHLLNDKTLDSDLNN